MMSFYPIITIILWEITFLESSNYHSSYHHSKDNCNTWCYNILAGSSRKDNYNTWCYNILASNKKKDNCNTWCYNILATKVERELSSWRERVRDRKWKRVRESEWGIMCMCVRERIIVTHDVIISLLAVRGRIIITHDVIISVQQKLRENYPDGEREWETENEREFVRVNEG